MWYTAHCKGYMQATHCKRHTEPYLKDTAHSTLNTPLQTEHSILISDLSDHHDQFPSCNMQHTSQSKTPLMDLVGCQPVLAPILTAQISPVTQASEFSFV